MSCDRVQDLLTAFADDDLSASDKAFVETHLASCPECAELLGLLRAADAALASFSEVEPPAALRERLYAVPEGKRRPGFFLAVLRRPALQPVLAGAMALMAVFTLYAVNPDRKQIDRALSLTFHRGISQVERLVARAGGVTDSLGAAADGVFVSLKRLNPLAKAEE